MEPFRLVMMVVTILLSIYSFLVFIRILLSWIPIPQLERLRQFLGSMVDPYLNRFRGITWLRFGMLDFSPVVGLILLSMIINITGHFAAGATAITAGYVISLLLSEIWRFIAFILGALIFLLVIRLVVSLINGKKHSNWGNWDSIIYNLMARIVGLFTRKSVSFNAGLAITLLVLGVLRIGGEFLIGFIIHLVRAL